MNPIIPLLLSFLPLLASCTQGARAVTSQREVAIGGIPVKTIRVERLPDLNTPRVMHAITAVGNELLVFGGVTTGFTITRTAEYYAMGQWHQIPMRYQHCSGFATTNSSGDILLGGGCAEDFGIGQTWGVERYIPGEHRFESLPILDRKRALCTAVELPDQSIVVSGNWYADDAIESYKPGGNFLPVKDAAEHRSYPYILPIAPDDAIIFSAVDTHGAPTAVLADRLKGEPFSIPLFEEYRPLPLPEVFFTAGQFCIGDPANDDYSYLIPVEGNDGEIRIALLRDGQFSLLETKRPIPAKLVIDGQRAQLGMTFDVDRDAEQAWLYIQYPDSVYILRIDYADALDGGRAGLTLYRTELPEQGLFPAVRLDDGRWLLAGGGPATAQLNFEPYKTVMLLSPEGVHAATAAAWWQIALLALVGAGLIALLARYFWRRKHAHSASGEAPVAAPETEMESKSSELFARIDTLMKEEELFRQQNLKILDVAQRLGTNVTYISSCINRHREGSFNDFVNRYRVDYAKQWLLDHPDKKISEVIEESGFASEASFFRNFKTLTDQTPTEWLAGKRRKDFDD